MSRRCIIIPAYNEAGQIAPVIEGARRFSDAQIRQIYTSDRPPDGYVWHHAATPGRMELVNADLHADVRHTGGRFIWGGGSECR